MRLELDNAEQKIQKDVPCNSQENGGWKFANTCKVTKEGAQRDIVSLEKTQGADVYFHSISAHFNFPDKRCKYVLHTCRKDAGKT